MQFDFGNLESPLSGTVFINGNLEPWRDALHSGHSGDTRPSYAVGGMTWIDTTTNPWIEKLFDGSEDIIKGYIDTTTNTYTPAGVSQAAEDISFDNTDSGLTATNVQDAIDEAVSDFSDFEGRADGFATAAQGALANTALQPGSPLIGINLGTQVTSPGGTTEIGFVGIPSGIKRLKFMIHTYGTSGTSPPQIQIGGSGGYETTGYLGSSTCITNSAVQSVLFTAGYGVGVNATFWGPSTVVHGCVTLDLENGNTWVADGKVSTSNTATTYLISGSKSLSSTLDRIRIISANGTDTVDSGSIINISWEF